MSVAAIGAVDYTKALDGLSLKQAQLMLTTQGIVGEEQKDLLVKQGLIATSDRMSASIVSEALANTALNKEQQEAILIKAGLMKQETKELITGNACTEAKLRAILAEKGIKGAKADTLIASILQTGQNSKEALSWKVLTASIWENIKATAKWMVTNPVGWVIMAAAAIGIAVSAVDQFNKAQEEARKEAVKNTEVYKEQKEELEDLKQQYIDIMDSEQDEATKAKELDNIKQALARTYGVEKEALDKLNQSRKEGLELLETEEQENAQRVINENQDEYNKYSKEAFDSEEGVTSSYTKTLYEQTLKESEIKSKLKEFGIDSDIDEYDSGNGIPHKRFLLDYGEDAYSALENIDKALEYYNDIEQKYGLSKEESVIISTLRKDFEKLNNYLYNEESGVDNVLSGTADAYWTKYKHEFEKSYNTAFEDINTSEGLESWKEGFYQSLGEFANDPYFKFFVDKIFADKANKISEVIENNGGQDSNSFKFSFSEAQTKGIDDFNSKISTLRDALQKLSTGELSNADLTKLIQQFPEIANASGSLSNVLSGLVDKELNSVIEILGTDAPETLLNSLRGIASESKVFVGELIDVDKQIGDLKQSYELLSSVQAEMSEKGKITINTLSDISALSDDMAKVVAEFLTSEQGVEDYNKVLKALEDYYEIDKKLFSDAIVLKAQTNETYTEKVYEDLETQIEGWANSYDIDLKNYKTLAKAKLAVEQKLITSCAEKWSKYYQVTIDTATGMAKIVGSPNINSAYDYKKFEESGEKEAWSAAQKAVNGYNEIINALDDSANANFDIDFDKIEGDFSSSLSNSLSGDSAKESTNKLFDWIEVKLENLKKNTTSLIDSITEYVSRAVKKSTLSKAITSVGEEIKGQQKAKDIYTKKANAVGLSQDWITKIQSGDYSIDELDPNNKKDAVTIKKIEEYQQWWDKIVSCDEAIEDLTLEEKDLIKQSQDLNIDELASKADAQARKGEIRQNKIDLKNAQGKSTTVSDYKALIKYSQDENEALKKQKKYIQSLIKGVEVGSDRYNELMGQLEDINDCINDNNVNQAEWNKQINELPISKIETQLSIYDKIKSYWEQFANTKSLLTGESSITTQDIKNQMYSSDAIDSQFKEYELYKQLRLKAEKEGRDEDRARYRELELEAKTTYLSMQESNEELRREARDLELYGGFEKDLKKINTVKIAIGNLNKFINDNSLFEDNGQFSGQGVSKIGVLVSEIEEARKEYSIYAKELSTLEANKNQYTSIDEYNEKHAEILEKINSSTEEIINKTQALNDLYKNQAKSELDALNKLIDKRSEALQKKKEYYDYDKNIKGQTKEISAIQNQIAALEGVNTAEAKAQKARLQAQLDNLKEELNETQKEHIYQLQIEGLDEQKEVLSNIYDEFIRGLNTSLEAQEKIIQDATSLSNTSQQLINSTLQKIAEFYGVDPSLFGIDNVAHFASGGIIKKVRAGGDDALAAVKSGETVLTSKFTDILPYATDVMDKIVSHWNSNVQINDKQKPSGDSYVVQYDSIIKVEGNVDKYVVEDLKSISKQVSNAIYKDLIKLGYKK